MLGQLLEIAIPARPVAETLTFYCGLGFQQIEVGDQPHSAAAVVICPGVAIGLHDSDLDGPVPIFVRPELSAHARALRHAGVSLEFASLADDQFNQAGFRDPTDRLVLLLEARTWSPATWNQGNVSLCGEFLELSLPTHSTQDCCRFWETLGCELTLHDEQPASRARLEGYGLALGYYEAGWFPAGLTFIAPDLAARVEFLKAKGYAPRPGAPVAAAGRPAATLLAPQGTAIYLLEP
jgi:catechol 2,3-dioxygenase-like lactoylglutathione lyase family enzyme